VSGKPGSSAPAPIDSARHMSAQPKPSRPPDADQPSSRWRAVAADPALQEQLATEALFMLERTSLEEDDG
jgi:hypothetical protein